MKTKNLLAIIVGVLLVIGIVAAITVTMSTPADDVQQASAEDSTSDEAKSSSAGSADKAAAEALIGESVSKDDVQSKVGEWDKFEMSSAGCERGVYSGTFYYDGFYISTRTYDKGQTFTVNAVNE